MSKKKMHGNILLVANNCSDVGFAWWLMENFWAEIASNFGRDDVASFLIYPEIRSIPEVIARSSLKIIQHDFAKHDYRSISTLLRIIDDNDIGCIYLTDRRYFDWLYLLLRAWGVKRIVNHDHMPGERVRVPWHKRLFKKLIHMPGVFSCDHYIGVSRFVRDRLIETACIHPSKCSYVHNGIRIFDNKLSGFAYEQFGIPEGSRIIVTTGRATFYKGIDVLIYCARKLLIDKKIDGLYFLHVGDGPDLEEFKKLAIDLKVDHRFIFAGFRKDIQKILPCCHIGIQLSEGEAFSLSILEYLCAGLATLAPNHCGNHEAITNGVNGLLYTPRDVAEIAQKIEVLLSDEDMRSSLGRKGRETVVDKFDLRLCNRRLIGLLKEQFA